MTRRMITQGNNCPVDAVNRKGQSGLAEPGQYSPMTRVFSRNRLGAAGAGTVRFQPSKTLQVCRSAVLASQIQCREQLALPAASACAMVCSHHLQQSSVPKAS